MRESPIYPEMNKMLDEFKSKDRYLQLYFVKDDGSRYEERGLIPMQEIRAHRWDIIFYACEALRERLGIDDGKMAITDFPLILENSERGIQLFIGESPKRWTISKKSAT